MTGTMTLEEIMDEIKEMGYVTVTPSRDEMPSFYRLKDGTIVMMLITIHHIVEDPHSPPNSLINSTASSICYVPKKNRHPELYKPFTNSDIKSNITDEDMEPDTLLEDFNSYYLSNGMILSVKAVISQVSKTRLFTSDGTPLYLINGTPIIKTKKGSSKTTPNVRI